MGCGGSKEEPPAKGKAGGGGAKKAKPPKSPTGAPAVIGKLKSTGDSSDSNESSDTSSIAASVSVGHLQETQSAAKESSRKGSSKGDTGVDDIEIRSETSKDAREAGIDSSVSLNSSDVSGDSNKAMVTSNKGLPGSVPKKKSK